MKVSYIQRPLRAFDRVNQTRVNPGCFCGQPIVVVEAPTQVRLGDDRYDVSFSTDTHAYPHNTLKECECGLFVMYE